METAGWTRLNACRLQTNVDAGGAEGALVDFLCLRIEFRNVEWTTGYAILTDDAVLLLKIDDAIGVLDDGAIGRARAQTARVRTVHALVLAHEHPEGAVREIVLVEPDEIVVIPARVRHGLVAVVECRHFKRITVPLHTGHLARLASDARRNVDQLADALPLVPLRVLTGGRTGMARNGFYFK